MRICVFQPPYPSGDDAPAAERTLQWILDSLKGLAPGQNDLIVLPEYANAPGLTEREGLRAFSETAGAGLLESLGPEAARLGSLLAVGTVCRDGPNWFNRTLLYAPDGQVLAAYDKTHLTAVEQDKLGLMPGSRPTAIEWQGVRFGFATCFELYFPEYFESLAALKPHIIICPTYQRSESGERNLALARCRALDCGAFLVRSSYAMPTPGQGGCSLVATPDGTLAASLGHEPGLLTVEIEPTRKYVKPASHGEPLIEHRELIESHRHAPLYRPNWEKRRAAADRPFPRLCAHRGLSEMCPENTLPAFGAALALGVAEIELDLWLTSDGVPVVCHDQDVKRTTNGEGNLSDMSWDRVRRLEAGASRGEFWGGVRIPRFEEGVRLVDGRASLNIHIKDPRPHDRLVEIVCDLLRREALVDTAYIAGGEHVLEAARRYAPEIPRACLASPKNPAEQLAIARRYDCRRVQFSSIITDENIRDARESGIICNLFYSDEPGQAREYLHRGIDVILTNRANYLGGVLDEGAP